MTSKRIQAAAHFASLGGKARNQIEMIGIPYGRLTAVKKGVLGWYTFRCDCGGEVQRQGCTVRQRAKKFAAGEAKTGPSCGGCP